MKRYAVLLLAALIFTSAARADWRNSQFEATAAVAAGWPVPVVCREAHEWPDATVRAKWPGRNIRGYFGGGAVILSPNTCIGLLWVYWYGGRGVPFTDPRTLTWQAGALLTLLHEATHASGDRDEGSTECKALRLFPSVARSIGVADVDAFTKLAWFVHEQKPPEYKTGCKDGQGAASPSMLRAHRPYLPPTGRVTR